MRSSKILTFLSGSWIFNLTYSAILLLMYPVIIILSSTKFGMSRKELKCRIKAKGEQ